jgi:putative aldouronate transport system substrate-binding protein
MILRERFFSKILFVFAVIALCAGLSSCSDTGNRYEIKWYFIGNGQQRDVKLIEDAVDKYLAQEGINATIKLQCYAWGDEYNNKMQMIIASGEQFDICFTSSWANYYRQNVAKGAFLDITDLAKKYAPKTWAQLHPSFITGSAINGRNYAIPANKELAHQWGLMFNKALVDKYKLDVTKVKKIEDIESMLAIIKEKEPGVVPFQNTGTENADRILDWDHIGDSGCPGSLYVDSKDMKVVNEVETPEYKAYYKLAHKYYLAGYIAKDSVSGTYDWMTERKAGKAFVWSDSLKPFANEERTASYGLDLVQVELTPPVVTTYDTTGSMQAVSKTSNNPEIVLKFLELFNTDIYLNNLINFGIEGTHWVKKGNNLIDFPAGVTGQNSGYNPGTPWMFGNQYINYFHVGENLKKWDAFQKFNNDSIPSKSLGFNFDNEPVKSEIAACINVYKEYMPGLISGAVDPDKVLPEYLAKLKAVGMDKVIAEKQKQLDAWLTNKK